MHTHTHREKCLLFIYLLLRWMQQIRSSPDQSQQAVIPWWSPTHSAGAQALCFSSSASSTGTRKQGTGSETNTLLRNVRVPTCGLPCRFPMLPTLPVNFDLLSGHAKPRAIWKQSRERQENKTSPFWRLSSCNRKSSRVEHFLLFLSY